MKCDIRVKGLTFGLLLGAAIFCAGCPRVHVPADQNNSTVEGQLVDQAGRPVSQQAVKLEALDNPAVSAIAFTDFSGYFQFLNLPAGKYRCHALADPPEQGWVVDVTKGQHQNIGTITLRREIKVNLNKEAAKTINPGAAKVINPEAAKTLNAEAAKTISTEAAKTINPAAARTINPQAAETINPAAARTINAEAAKTINPAAARVLNPERAKVLTKERAKTISPAEAKKPPSGS